MIKISIKKENDNIKSIKVTGHANSAEYGKDLVCAAISTICIGMYNVIDHRGFLSDKSCVIDIDEGFMNLRILKQDEVLNVIVESMADMFDTVEDAYPKYVKIKMEV